MITIEKLFDDGEDVLSGNPDVSFLHTYFIYSFIYQQMAVFITARLSIYKIYAIS